MESPEMLTIRWDGFMAYRRKSLRELREKDEFNDVTLIAGDGKQVRAQQVILAGGSSFFYVVLKDNVHEDPSIYLTGVKYENLVSLLDYIYTGEANIAQQDLNQFVDILEEYKVQGLLKIGTLEETDDKKAKSNIFTPAPLQSQVTHEEPCPSLKVSNPHSAISSSQDPVATEERSAATRIIAPHEGRVATQERSAAPKISAPHEGRVATQNHSAATRLTASHEGRVATQERSAGPKISAQHEGRVATEKRVSAPRVYAPHEGQVATVKRASSNPDISHSNNILPKSTCMEGYGGISNVKVEVEDDSGFDVYYGKNKPGEEYIRNVSKRVVAKVQRKGLCMEQNNYKSVFTGRNEENDNSGSEAQVKQAKIFDNDWYQLDKHPLKECSVNIKKVTIKKLTEVSSKSSIYSENYDHQENLDKTDNSERSFDREGMVDSNYDMIDIQVEDKRSHTGNKTYWYQCEFCHKKFSYLSQLNQHERIHTGEKPYQCSVCHEKFSESSNLNRHNRVHTGEKPYQCLVCHKKFSQSSNLNQHNSVHTGEKPYQCLVCHKKFAQSSNLNKHNRVHTGEKFEKK